MRTAGLGIFMATPGVDEGVKLPKVETYQLWYAMAVFWFIVGTVAALGEWVFHWWRDPGQWLALLGFGLAVFSAAFGASSRDLQRTRDDLAGEMRRGFAHQTQELKESMAEQTRVLKGGLDEVVASFRAR